MSKQEENLERIYTVPLTRAWITARHKRTKRAVKVLREFAEKHMKSEEVKIDTELNERLWSRGITKPPRKITVRMEKDEDGVVTVSLPKVEKPSELLEEKKALPEKKRESLPSAEALPGTKGEAALPPAEPTAAAEPEAPKAEEENKEKPKTKASPKKKNSATKKAAARKRAEKKHDDE